LVTSDDDEGKNIINCKGEEEEQKIILIFYLSREV